MHLIDGSEDSWEIGKVTARREKALSELGLARESFAPEEGKSADEILKEILDNPDKKLQSLIKTLFVGREIKEEELLDIDKIEIQKGVMGFFLADLELMSEYSPLLTTLSSLKLPETKQEN